MSPLQIRTSRTLSDEAVDLAAYRISEKVTERLIRRATFWLSVITALLALTAFLGLSTFKSSITRAVEDNVNATIERETKQLSDRVRNDLVDIEVSSLQVKKDSSAAQAQLDSASASLSKIQGISARYNELSEKFDGVNRRLTSASNEALQDIENLRRAQLDAAAGRPSIVSWEFNPRKGTTSIIQGTNFGDTFGNISVRVAYRHSLTADTTYLPPLAFTAWISIDRQSISKWSNTMIALKFSEAFIAKYGAAIANLGVGNPDAENAPPEVSNYRIETTSGSFNEIE